MNREIYNKTERFGLSGDSVWRGVKFTIVLTVAMMLFVTPALLSAEEQEGTTGSRRPTMRATLSADTVLIGDHFFLDVEVTKDMVQMVEFPRLDQIADGSIELLGEEPIDTLEVDGRMQRLLKRYRLIAFEEGIYNIDSFPLLYLDKNIVDTIFDEQMNRLVIDTYIVDTASQTIFDIKPPMDAPLMVGEVSGYVGFGVALLAVLAAVLYLAVRHMSRKGVVSDVYRPREAPHVIAIRQLEQLANQKIWQNNKHKLYYTRITDILREYIDSRYGISAREMTSDEILDAVKELELGVKDYEYLQEILRDADLVKFAKFVPEPERNEKAYYSAYYFVEDTKQTMESTVQIEDEPIVETIRPEAVEDERSDNAAAGEENVEPKEEEKR